MVRKSALKEVSEPVGYLRRRGKEIKSGACSVSLNNSKGGSAAAQGHKDNSTL